MQQRRVVGLVLLAAAAPALGQDIVQVTDANGADSGVSVVGPKGSNLVAISSSGDLVPASVTSGAPGNADGSAEVFLLDVKTGALVQASNAGGAEFESVPNAILGDGTLLFESTADLTPGMPGHPTDQFNAFSYLYRPRHKAAPASLLQITPAAGTGGLRFVQSVRKNRVILFTSTGDPIAGTQSDQHQQAFLYDRKSAQLTQLTSGTGESYATSPDDGARQLLVQSSSNLAGGGRNTDGSLEIFLYDVATKTFGQVTNEPAGIDWYPVIALDAKGRMQVMHRVDSTGAELVVGTSVLDLKKGTSTTLYAGTDFSFNQVKRVISGSRGLVLNSRNDLSPLSITGPGNADGTLEVFTIDVKTKKAVQRTASTGDTSFSLGPFAKGRTIAVASKSDLAPGAPGNAAGVFQIYFVPVVGPPVTPVQITNGDRDCFASGIDDKQLFLAFRSKADLVAGHNADHTQEIFLVNLKGKPVIRQMTETDKDVTFRGFLHDGKSFLVTTKADLAPGMPGNADGSTEVYRIRYR